MLLLTASEARGDFSGTLKRVRRGERVLLSNHNKVVAAIVSVEDLALLRAIEDRADLAAAREALKETPVDWDDVKGGLGID
jgi:prevent-host-death family protein